jgi:hypothetical protein
MLKSKFTDQDYWKGIILYGLNAATYKMAFARCLFEFSQNNQSHIVWNELAESFLKQYQARLASNPRPQQAIRTRMTVMERVVKELHVGAINYGEAVDRVAENGLEFVVPCFQTIGRDKDLVRGHFYEFEQGKKLRLKDSLLGFTTEQIRTLEEEVISRWSLLEGAFTINQEQFTLSNNIREIYLEGGYKRTPLTSNLPFLTGYQGNRCFYCGEEMGKNIHVDHVLPRQVVCHDEMWNLVLAHGDCNLLKSDRIVGPHFIEKLIARNENIMGSNHPWRHKISAVLGTTKKKRSSSLNYHYENVKKVLGSNYWGGSDSYNPQTDPFFKRLITVLNNKELLF